MRKPPAEVDPVDEVHAVRDALSKQCDYDVGKLARLIKADEVRSGASLVSRPPRRIRNHRTAS